MPDAPRVFISYSHDNREHRARVLTLADRLRDDGVDAEIDQYEQAPDGGWYDHCIAEIRGADFVLIAFTATYRRRWYGEEETGKGLGVKDEANLIKAQFSNAGSRTGKFVPILFADMAEADIPDEMSKLTRYRVGDEHDYEALYRRLTDQHPTPRRPLGPIRQLPPRERRPAPGVGAQSAPSANRPPSAGMPHPRVAEVFVGRLAQLDRLAALIFPANGAPRPAVISGMAGVGKSYLADRFY
jgi:hypothetical protein